MSLYYICKLENRSRSWLILMHKMLKQREALKVEFGKTYKFSVTRDNPQWCAHYRKRSSI